MALVRSSFSLGSRLNFKLLTLLKENNTSKPFHTGFTFLKNKPYLKEPLAITLRSSRPLKEDDSPSEKARNPRKREQYVIFGDVSVDEETFRKMQDEESDYDDMDEEDIQNVLQNRNELYHLYQQEEKEHRKFIRTKTLERKLFPRQIEPCLLTWAARDQIKYLHNLDPEQWTAEEVAKYFPVSVLGATKLLRSTFRYTTEKRIKNYDDSVKRNWSKVCKGDIENLDPSLQERWMNKQLMPSQALPNPSLPLPPPRNPDPSPLLLDNPRESVGEFYAIVKPYVELVKQAKSMENQNALVAANSNSSSVALKNMNYENDSQVYSFRNKPCQTLDDELGETDERKYRLKMKRTMHVTHEQFQESMKDALRNKEPKSQEDLQMLDWLENQRLLESGKSTPSSVPLEDQDMEGKSKTYKKYKEQPKVMYDNLQNTEKSKHEQAYVYSSNTGYQHPFGKSENFDRIKIDPSFEKEGELYKVGDSFYSEDGEFIFRVFTK